MNVWYAAEYVAAPAAPQPFAVYVMLVDVVSCCAVTVIDAPLVDTEEMIGADQPKEPKVKSRQ